MEADAKTLEAYRQGYRDAMEDRRRQEEEEQLIRSAAKSHEEYFSKHSSWSWPPNAVGSVPVDEPLQKA